ncbi:MAG TPA: Ig-like domain-containing protein, partial [Actinomycetota bacterium]|nr:Ig-like domain-containing protein [Actinomycetota bacterium]
NLDADSSTTGGVDYLTAFTDGGPAVAIVDTDVLITDTDDIELTSATVTLTNPDTNDVLLFNGAPPAGIAASLYDPVTGILTLTGTASLAAYQAALQQITFANTGTNPSTETRIIDVVVNDGTVASNLAHAIVEVTQVNNSAPTLDLDGNNTTLPGTSYSTTFTENGPPVAIADTDTLIGDPDIGGAIASATITLTNPQIGDLLTATLPLPGGITASAYDPVTGTLTLSNVASFADYETALEAIRFSTAGDNPVAGTRIIQVVVNDGIHNSQPATSHITVVAANDAPALVVADASYQENADPVLLSPSASLTDADDTELTSAAVQIAAGSFPGDGDILTVGGDPTGTGITFLWDPTLHALVFTGASSVANYQALLQTVQFQSTSHNPADFGASPQRTLTWFVSDGTAVTSATTTLDIVTHDDPAVAVPEAVATTENALIRARAVAGNLFNNNGFGPDSDPDGGTFAVTAVSAGAVGTPITLPSGALLTVNADGTFNYNPNHLFDYLPTFDSGASNLTITDTFAYAITGGDTATVTVTVSGVDTNDVLYDSAGIDSLAGGILNDVYYVHNTGDVVTEAVNAGSDTVAAFVNYTLPASSTVEVLNMIGSG